MKQTSSLKTLLDLFISFLKIGALTFGGGYAMIPIIQRETVEKRKWVNENDILDVIAIAESTPGPIAVNAATFIGFKMAGFLGAIFATLGLVLPSFAIIYLISIFYDAFIKATFVKAIFKGLSIGVIALITLAFFKLKKNMKLTISTTIIFFVVIIYLVISYFLEFTIPFSTFILILFGFVFGATLEAIKGRK